MAKRNRIPYALWLHGWDFERREVGDLMENGEAIPPEDYTPNMRGSIFCPSCYTPLFRSPAEKARFSDESIARYNHYAAFSKIDCSLRAPKSEALRFLSEELARQAVDNGKLTVVHEFLSAPSDIGTNAALLGGVRHHEDIDGPIASYPIARCKGENFSLPTKISSVASICRRFDANLLKYYLLPGRRSALLLLDELTDIRTVNEPDATPRLYFAKVIASHRMGKSDQNLRMTYFSCNPGVKDFCMKATIAEQREKGIDDNSDRFVLIWGRVVESGIGLCIDRPKWGEYALLPIQYERLLPFEV